MTDMPHAMAGPSETLHLAMAEILSRNHWWDLPETTAIAIGFKTVGASIHPDRIREEFRNLRVERGLSPVKSD